MTSLRGVLEAINADFISGWAYYDCGESVEIPDLCLSVNGRVVEVIGRSSFFHKESRGYYFKYIVPDAVSFGSDDDVVITSPYGGKLGPVGSSVPSLKTPDVLPGRAPDVRGRPSYRSLILAESKFKEKDLHDARKIAIYVTFSYSGKFFKYQRRQVRELQSAGYYVVAVHASNKKGAYLSTDRLGDVDLWKSNIGYDFGSWWIGLRWLDRNRPDFESSGKCLILCNDSCFGFVSKQVISSMENRSGDVIGVCDSWEHSYHLQSFFVLCKERFLRSGEFCDNLRSYSFPTKKRDVIRSGELLLSESALRAGASVEAFCSYDDIALRWLSNMEEKISKEISAFEALGVGDRLIRGEVEEAFCALGKMIIRGARFNPSHLFWEEVNDCGVNLLKRELALLNPINIPDHNSLMRSCGRNIMPHSEMQIYLTLENKSDWPSKLMKALSAMPCNRIEAERGIA